MSPRTAPRIATRSALRPGRRRRAAVTAVLAAGAVLAATPALASPAFASDRGNALPPVNPTALRAALSGLPNDAITAATARVSGWGGSWSGASGTADLATGQPARTDMRFRIGSVTKVFTATVVLQLAAEHRLDLNRPVQSYLPGLLPAAYPPVTIAQLLNHTSGLPSVSVDDDEQDPASFVAHRFDDPTPAQIVAGMAGRPMEFTPGTAQEYNGINYFLLGLLVEGVTHDSYANQVTDRIIRPLHLTDTEVPAGTDDAIPGPHLHGYITVTQNGTTQLVDVTEQSPYPWAEGGMISSTRDLSTVLTALVGGRLLPPAQQADLFVVPDVPYVNTDQCQLQPDVGRACFSMGLMSSTVDGTTVWGKTGSRPGYTDGVFATRNLQRVVAYAFTPTDRDANNMPFILGIALAAFEGTVPAGASRN